MSIEIKGTRNGKVYTTAKTSELLKTLPMNKDNTPREIRRYSPILRRSKELPHIGSAELQEHLHGEWVKYNDHESALQELREEKETWTFEYNKIWDALKEELEKTQSLQAKVERLEDQIEGLKQQLEWRGRDSTIPPTI